MTNATMAWIDLETTGLSASLDVPLELGIVLTDDHLNVIDSCEWLIMEDNDDYKWGLERGHKDPFVEPMHQKSGLWEDLINRNFAKMTRANVDDEACQFLQDNGVKYGTLPMCGSSVGSLDRPFTLVHFPAFNEALSYRNIDISSFKEACRRVNPELFENLKSVAHKKASASHRVMEDIEDSILEYKSYLDNFLITGDNY